MEQGAQLLSALLLLFLYALPLGAAFSVPPSSQTFKYIKPVSEIAADAWECSTCGCFVKIDLGSFKIAPCLLSASSLTWPNLIRTEVASAAVEGSELSIIENLLSVALVRNSNFKHIDPQACKLLFESDNSEQFTLICDCDPSTITRWEELFSCPVDRKRAHKKDLLYHLY